MLKLDQKCWSLTFLREWKIERSLLISSSGGKTEVLLLIDLGAFLSEVLLEGSFLTLLIGDDDEPRISRKGVPV